MSNEDITRLYYDNSLRNPDIARILGCSSRTLTRRFQRLGLPSRLARPWRIPTTISPELGYFLGAWITDGSLTYRLGQILVHNTNLEFLRYVQHCAEKSSIPGIKPIKPNPNPNRKGSKPQYLFRLYSKIVSTWILDQTGKRKQHIPVLLFESPKSSKLAFLSAAIDGDGHVTKEGCIRIRGSYPWLLEMPQLCREIGIRCTQPRLERILPSGKPYRRISIHRSDFIESGGQLIIPHKQTRLKNPIYRTNRKKRDGKTSACPICNNPKYPQAKTCQACYLASDQLQERLRSIAHAGGIAGAAARWGSNPEN